MSLPGTPQVEVSHLEPSGPVPMEKLHVTQTLLLSEKKRDEQIHKQDALKAHMQRDIEDNTHIRMIRNTCRAPDLSMWIKT